MMKKNVVLALVVALLIAASTGCASSHKAKCTCPSFRGSRAIYGQLPPRSEQPQAAPALTSGSAAFAEAVKR